jgi:hypothetical protein
LTTALRCFIPHEQDKEYLVELFSVIRGCKLIFGSLKNPVVESLVDRNMKPLGASAVLYCISNFFIERVVKSPLTSSSTSGMLAKKFLGER